MIKIKRRIKLPRPRKPRKRPRLKSGERRDPLYMYEVVMKSGTSRWTTGESAKEVRARYGKQVKMVKKSRKLRP